ncbi:MAG: nucleotidyltransferase domain-containing protein [Mesorhizobium sp.]|nr:nucleotidyltransferase domain-containing protein [Mesorhizobium sp.]
MKNSLLENIINISMFGSRVRGDEDERSDCDVVVVVKDGSGTVPEQSLQDFLLPLIGSHASISWYGLRKMVKMFADGDLFAWHLYLESLPLAGFPHLSKSVGRPAGYTRAYRDIAELEEILVEVEWHLRRWPANAIYEAGILYVCARNIAMSASWHLSTPSFGRYSPYHLPSFQFPLPPRTYDIAMSCRMASQRGSPPPKEVDASWVLAVHADLVPWSAQIKTEVKNVIGRHSQLKKQPIPDQDRVRAQDPQPR